ncbi:hypothetical protein K3495_g114 [Podosphaera aphanis]|nr:hypothetical protein K3495_g114 [Podosphaera aphanis]
MRRPIDVITISIARGKTEFNSESTDSLTDEGIQ